MGSGINERAVNMSAIQTWFHMGGYAGYVWPAYLVVSGVFIAHVMYAKAQKKRVLKQLQLQAERAS